MNLTPQLLINDTDFPVPDLPSLSIFLLKDQLQVSATSRDRLVTGHSFYPIFGEYLLIDNIPTRKQITSPIISIFYDCLWYIERAFKGLRIQDWQGFGFNLDKAFTIEMLLLEPNKICDIAYSTARTYGAYGGYSANNKLFLVCPDNQKDIIQVKVNDAIRSIS